MSSRRELEVEGTVIAIPLPGEGHGYGQVIVEGRIAFLELFTEELETDVARVLSAKAAFHLLVRTHLSSWNVIGWRRELVLPGVIVIGFMQDLANWRKCTIYFSDGSFRQAAPDECIALERISVWDPHHVEERLVDLKHGRPSRLVELGRVRLGDR